MDSIVHKLTEIENDANEIIRNAEQEKRELEQKNHKAMDELQNRISQETQEKVNQIRQDLQNKKNAELSGREESVDKAIRKFKDDFKTKHSEYAKQILNKIIEV